jgi:hypothetical protein
MNDMTHQNPAEINNLQRREIQAPLVVSLIREFSTIIGHEKAMSIARTAIQKDAVRAGQSMAAKFGGNDLTELLQVVREIWAGAGALEFEVTEQTEKVLAFNVHRCLYAELYDRTGIKEYGDCLSCCRDEAFILGFNRRIKLSRSQTIMQGAAICDFRFTLES